MTDAERRTLLDTAEGMQTRTRPGQFATRAEGDDLIIEGYFIVFGVPYMMWDDFEEVISPRAIDANTDTSDVRALINHDSRLVLARHNEHVNTLDFKIDSTGLFATIRVNAGDTDAVNLHARVQRGDVDQASFGFNEDAVRYDDLPGDRTRRTVEHISKLWEISVCTFPAYEQTHVDARSGDPATIRQEAQQARTKNWKEKMKGRFYHA